MTPHAKRRFNQYNHAMDSAYHSQSFVNAAVWLDRMRYKEVAWCASMHYIDLPFTEDNSPLFPPQEINSVWAIEKAKLLLFHKYATKFHKGIALRVILHVAGDLHQPLHAATRVSRDIPQGDQGGNLVPIMGSSVAKNLHSYWDSGGGSLKTKHRRYKSYQVAKRAKAIMTHWPCNVTEADPNPLHWVAESHALAINIAYKMLPKNNVIDKKYHQLLKDLSEERLALAGCRLAALLNQIDSRLNQMKMEG